MNLFSRYLLAGTLLSLAFGLPLAWDQDAMPGRSNRTLSFGTARFAGRIESRLLVECSGMDVSMAAAELLWAINDSGGGPFVYALGSDGRDRGRLKVAGAENRDWEGLDTFMWQGRPMILIADIGDNRQQHAAHTLYVIPEPRLHADRLAAASTVAVAWQIHFVYPDGRHDAEGAAVDTAAGEVLVLTKRDKPPLLFALPLAANPPGRTVTARLVAAMNRIPEPTPKDLQQAYGAVRSQPTAIDLSPDGMVMAVLTYKHAYLFGRNPGDSWAVVTDQPPALVALPLPEDCGMLKQRESICFSKDGASLLVASEGSGAEIFRVDRNQAR